MEDLNSLSDFFKEFIQNKMNIVIVGIAAVIGAIAGIAAFYNGWLG